MIEHKKYFPTLVRDLKTQRYLLILVWPAVIWLFIFWFLPLIGIVGAFEDYNVFLGYFRSKWVGMKYFAEIFTDPMMRNALRNTLMYSFSGLIVGFPIPIIFALMLNELYGMYQFKRVVQTVSYLPYFLSWAFVASFMISFFAGDGLFNQILKALGIDTHHYAYMAHPISFISIILGSGLWKGYGIGSILYLSAMTTVNPELYDAAVIDGANRWQKIRFITFPGIKTTTIVLLILSISGLINSNFEQFYLMGNTAVSDIARVIDVYTYNIGIVNSRFSYGTAVGLFKSLVSLLLLIMANAASKKIAGESIY